LGMVLGLVARYDAALPVLEQAAETYRAAGDLESLGGVTAQIATVYSERGRPDAGLQRIHALLAFVEARGPSRVLAGLYYALAHLHYFSGRLGEALAATERVVEIARTIGDERLLATAEMARGNE